MTEIFIFIVFAVIAIMFYVTAYNSLISLKNSVEESFSAIDTVFQNRYDLIPNLVEVVKQYASHEKEVLTQVVKLRSSAMGNQEVSKEKLAQENMLSGTLKSIFALSENYPDLKANEQFLDLQKQWTEMEDRMQGARRAYNAAVKALTNKREMIPSNIVASFMTFKDFPLFEADVEARENLNAKELFSK